MVYAVYLVPYFVNSLTVTLSVCILVFLIRVLDALASLVLTPVSNKVLNPVSSILEDSR